MPPAEEHAADGERRPPAAAERAEVELAPGEVEEELDDQAIEALEQEFGLEVGDDEATAELDVEVWTIKRHKDADPVAQDYLSDLLNGMVELGLTRCFIRREEPLPYFGFLTQKPVSCTFDALAATIGHLIEVEEERLRWGAEGVIKAVSGEDGILVDLLFGVEVGPRLQWIRFTREIETRVLRKGGG